MNTQYICDNKIAVIMPIHNTPANYLQEALESLKSQVFQKFRLICVDDGSTNPGTIQILQEWSEKQLKKNILFF